VVLWCCGAAARRPAHRSGQAEVVSVDPEMATGFDQDSSVADEAPSHQWLVPPRSLRGPNGISGPVAYRRLVAGPGPFLTPRHARSQMVDINTEPAA
jgi:hypothetical protein